MSLTLTPTTTADVEPDELETTPMTDAEHAAVFGWAWDDPDHAEAGA